MGSPLFSVWLVSNLQLVGHSLAFQQPIFFWNIGDDDLLVLVDLDSMLSLINVFLQNAHLLHLFLHLVLVMLLLCVHRILLRTFKLRLFKREPNLFQGLTGQLTQESHNMFPTPGFQFQGREIAVNPYLLTFVNDVCGNSHWIIVLGEVAALHIAEPQQPLHNRLEAVELFARIMGEGKVDWVQRLCPLGRKVIPLIIEQTELLVCLGHELGDILKLHFRCFLHRFQIWNILYLNWAILIRYSKKSLIEYQGKMRAFLVGSQYQISSSDPVLCCMFLSPPSSPDSVRLLSSSQPLFPLILLQTQIPKLTPAKSLKQYHQHLGVHHPLLQNRAVTMMINRGRKKIRTKFLI